TYSEEEQEGIGHFISRYFKDAMRNAVRAVVLKERVRLDGRKPDEIRNIWTEVDYLPSTHGSSVFTRGETQALATVTLGTSREAMLLIHLHYKEKKLSTYTITSRLSQLVKHAR